MPPIGTVQPLVCRGEDPAAHAAGKQPAFAYPSGRLALAAGRVAPAAAGPLKRRPGLGYESLTSKSASITSSPAGGGSAAPAAGPPAASG